MRVKELDKVDNILLPDYLLTDGDRGSRAVTWQNALAQINNGLTITDSISDAFDETKDYSVGQYCIYLNSVYKFVEEKTAGSWDGSKVVPCTIMGEITELNGRIIITDITNETDGAGRIGTSFSTLHHFIIGAQLMSPRVNEQAYVNVSSNPIDSTIFVDCPEHKNETITVKLIVYKFA